MSAATRYAIAMAPVVTDDLLALIDGRPTETPLPALTKRAAFFLEELMSAGAEGITTIDYPGVRVGDAIFKLRKAGVEIETKHEPHGGDFAGNHGRYILRSRIVRLDTAPNPAVVTSAEQRAAL